MILANFRRYMRVGKLNSDFETVLVRNLGIRTVPALLLITTYKGSTSVQKYTSSMRHISAKGMVEFASGAYTKHPVKILNEVYHNGKGRPMPDTLGTYLVLIISFTPGGMFGGTHAFVVITRNFHSIAASVRMKLHALYEGENADKVKVILISKRKSPHIMWRWLSERLSEDMVFVHLSISMLPLGVEREVTRKVPGIGVYHAHCVTLLKHMSPKHPHDRLEPCFLA